MSHCLYTEPSRCAPPFLRSDTGVATETQRFTGCCVCPHISMFSPSGDLQFKGWWNEMRWCSIATAWLNTVSVCRSWGRSGKPVVIHISQQDLLCCAVFSYRGHSQTTCLSVCFVSQGICVFILGLFSVWHLSNPGDEHDFILCLLLDLGYQDYKGVRQRWKDRYNIQLAKGLRCSRSLCLSFSF